MSPELKQIAGNTYYIPGAVNIGVLIKGRECLLIDTGLDRQAGKQILRVLEQENLSPTVIVNTHSHADHFGGNAVIREQKGALVYASSFEKAVIENPYLEPFYLFSAAPVKELTNRFLMAPPSPVDGILTAGPAHLHGFDLDIILLPGHSPGQIGVVTGDNVCFTADAYFDTAILEKYGMPYTADVSAAIDTLRVLWQSDYSWYTPCHGTPSGKPTETILRNVAIIEKTLEQVLAVLAAGPRTREEVLAGVMTANNRELNAIQYVLNHSAVTACLSHLYRIGKAEYDFAEGKMLWRKAAESLSCFTGG